MAVWTCRARTASLRLGESNRVCQVVLHLRVGAPMHVLIPELTDLRLFSADETPPVIPDSFLNGSAPRLESFLLSGIPFPGFPNCFRLLTILSTSSSTVIFLIPGTFHPKRSSLSSLLCLDTFSLEFQSHQSHPDWENQSLPPPKRSIIPALDQFRFKGVVEYLEQLVTFIDAPQLNLLSATFFNQIDFDCPLHDSPVSSY